MNYRADLHCHTIYSDGTYSPKELLKLAKEKSLSALCITDHDTLDAYSDETFKEADKLGLKLFVGIELSARHLDHNVHLLGYNVSLTPEMYSFCEEHKKRRKKRNSEILKKLQQFSFLITEEELNKGREDMIVGRPHIAAIMIKKGYVKSIKEAFNRYLGDGKSCYVVRDPFSVEETIKYIHQAGGKAFIAHPHLIKPKKNLRLLLEMDFDGIECYYALIHASEEKKYLQIAEEKNWLISGGSDFHGEIKPHIPLGCSWVDETAVKKIFGTI